LSLEVRQRAKQKDVKKISADPFPGSRGLGLHAATAFLLQGAKLVIVTARKAGGSKASTRLSSD
jgi:hypothetical protein